MAPNPAFCSSTGYLNVPSELFTMIVSHLETQHLKQLMESNKDICILVEHVFYRRVWTRQQTRCDVAGLVSLLRRRPEICHFIRDLYIDEMGEQSFRELLGLELPNLETINIDHVHGSVNRISAKRREELNAVIRLKPRLSSFSLAVLDGCGDGDAVQPKEDYEIHEEDFVYFNHPTLTRLKLAHLNLSALRNHPKPFPMEALKHLEIDECYFRISSLQNILLRATSLLSFRFHHRRLSFHRGSFVSLLSGCKQTLETLEFSWRSSRSTYDLRGPMLFEEFTAMKQLLVDPRALFVNYLGSTNLRPMLKHVLPPNLEVLMLEGVRERANEHESEQDHLDQTATIGQTDEKLLKDVISFKGEIVPQLRYVLLCDCSRIGDLDRFYEMAGTQNVRLGLLNTQKDQPVPNVEMLDSSWVEDVSDIGKGTDYEQVRCYNGRGWVCRDASFTAGEPHSEETTP